MVKIPELYLPLQKCIRFFRREIPVSRFRCGLQYGLITFPRVETISK
jgi:hypothetical protein